MTISQDVANKFKQSLLETGIDEPLLKTSYPAEDDMSYLITQLIDILPIFSSISEIRKLSLIFVSFNLGLQVFLGLKDLISAIQNNAWDEVENILIQTTSTLPLADLFKKIGELLKIG